MAHDRKSIGVGGAAGCARSSVGSAALPCRAIAGRLGPYWMVPTAVIAILATAAATQAVAQNSAPAAAASRNDTRQAVAERVRALIGAMTQDEKLAMVHGVMPGFVPKSRRSTDMIVAAGYVPGMPRLGIPPLRESDASLGVSNLANMRPGDVATALPSGLSTAATFDPEIARANGRMIGIESRAKGFNVQLAGGVNLAREPRNGRNFEYLGEDPLLAGTLAGAAVKGIQSASMVSTVKHYALNDQETGRNVLNAQMDESALRESDLLAFEIAIETGHPGAVMCAYNRVNGTYSCENGFLLNQVLKQDWHFPGWVMSDWGAVHSTEEAAMAGLDQESGEQLDTQRFFGAPLAAAIAAGRVPAARLDDMVTRILTSMVSNGLLGSRTAPLVDLDADARVAQRGAEQGIVLLKNAKGFLPLSPAIRRIAVIGAHADVGVVSGGGSSQVRPVGGPAIIPRPAGDTAISRYTAVTYDPSPPLRAIQALAPHASVAFVDGFDVQAAVAVAKQCDVVVLFAQQWMSEGKDAPDLNLPNGQDDLVREVARANPHVVVVLETGGPVLMPWLGNVAAVMEAWYPGQRGGEAIARVLFGVVDAAGRLPVTFPGATADLPNPVLPGASAPKATKATRARLGISSLTEPFNVTYPEGAAAGYKWYDSTGRVPAFPFGFGLSYTSFRYSNLKVAGGGSLKVGFRVTNIGRRPGADIPQAYVTPPGGRYRHLFGWKKLWLRPGQSADVSLTADPRVLANFDAGQHDWHVAAGTYRVQVGASERDRALGGAARLKDRRLPP